MRENEEFPVIRIYSSRKRFRSRDLSLAHKEKQTKKQRRGGAAKSSDEKLNPVLLNKINKQKYFKITSNMYIRTYFLIDTYIYDISILDNVT